jgi:short-subunit dehydrogenase
VGDLDGRTLLVTGANTGIGKETARALAARRARVVLACRSEAGGRRAIEEITGQTGNRELELLSLDLGDLTSVRECADAFLALDEPLHVLINNAGLAGLARRLDGTGVTTDSLHPGVIASDIWRSVPWPARVVMKRRMDSPEQGAETSVYCATAPELADQTGLYYQDCAPKQPGEAVTPGLAGELWERSADWVASG